MNLLRSTALLVSTSLLGGSAAAPRGDYTTIPPSPAEVHARLAKNQPLAKIIEAAESATGGLAGAISYDAAGNVTVHTYSPSAHVAVQVNGADGSVKSKTEIPRFPGVPVQGDWTETKSGLKYYDIVVGQGEKPAGPTTVVRVNYTVWLTDGTQIDSSNGKPYQTALNAVIAGWTQGVGSMQVGGKRKLIVPHDLAYGPNGRGGIPPKATLIFDVELVEIVK